MTKKPDDEPRLEKTVQEDDEDDERFAELKVTYHDKVPTIPFERGPSRDQLLGKVIGGHYVILELIGEGGMSRVYKAKHMLLNREVAVKYIHPRFVFDLPSVKRFQQEAQAATALKHPNICSVNEFGIDNEGRSYLVMDYIEGDSLSKRLYDQKKLPTEEALDIFIQISDGLEHAHSKGVIHRDITPGNIVLVRENANRECAKLVDFGIAKLVGDEHDKRPNLTRTGEVFGTPSYMSPEQCLGRNIDTRSDIYSLGCVMYEALTGAPPYPAESSLEVMMMHVNNEAPMIPASMLQSRLRDVVAQCMRKDPVHRYQNVKSLRTDLQAIQSGEAPTHLTPTKGAFGQTLKIAFVSVIVIVLLLVGYFIYQMTHIVSTINDQLPH